MSFAHSIKGGHKVIQGLSPSNLRSLKDSCEFIEAVFYLLSYFQIRCNGIRRN